MYSNHAGSTRTRRLLCCRFPAPIGTAVCACALRSSGSAEIESCYQDASRTSDDSSYLPHVEPTGGFVQVIFTVDRSIRALRTGQPYIPSDSLGANPRRSRQPLRHEGCIQLEASQRRRCSRRRQQMATTLEECGACGVLEAAAADQANRFIAVYR
ncbi:hypothetical protein M432DRAFT_112598 [Thermoascus aurantiacus ATCC 26904]